MHIYSYNMHKNMFHLITCVKKHISNRLINGRNMRIFYAYYQIEHASLRMLQLGTCVYLCACYHWECASIFTHVTVGNVRLSLRMLPLGMCVYLYACYC